MPFGFMKDLSITTNLSQQTLDSYEKRIEIFLAYLNKRYMEGIEPRQITANDVKDYIRERKNSGIKDSTLRNDFGAIKKFFDFLWRTDQIPVDFVSKIKFDFNLKRRSIHIDYRELLNAYTKICSSKKLKSTAKVLFILSMKGFRLKEILSLTKNNFQDNEDSIIVQVVRDNLGEFSVLFNRLIDMQCIRECLKEAAEIDSHLLLYSRTIKGEIEEMSKASITYLWLTIAKASNMSSLNNTVIRYAYIYYLSRVQGKSIEDIQQIMGLTLSTTSDLLKEAVLRIEQTDSECLYKEEESKKQSTWESTQ